MGGRLMLTTVQVTMVFKGEWSDEEVEKFMEELRAKYQSNTLFVEALLDENTVTDVEV